MLGVLVLVGSCGAGCWSCDAPRRPPSPTFDAGHPTLDDRDDDAGGGPLDAGVVDAGPDAGEPFRFEAPPPPPEVNFDPPSTFLGAMPISRFNAVLQEVRVELVDCYQYAIERQPSYPMGLENLISLDGWLKIDVEVGTSGAPDRVAVSKSSASLDGVMQRCAVNAVNRLRWGPASATTLATFTARFTQVPLTDEELDAMELPAPSMH